MPGDLLRWARHDEPPTRHVSGVGRWWVKRNRGLPMWHIDLKKMIFSPIGEKPFFLKYIYFKKMILFSVSFVVTTFVVNFIDIGYE